MPALLLALAMLFADEPAATEAPPPPSIPVGAPSDDYGLVAWCYGTLGGYLDLYDQVMPEVTRIESTYRAPGSRLADDLKVYSDMRAEGRANLKLFARAIEAAEKANPRPISTRGAEAVKKGRGNWAAAASLSKARVAQEWMSWSLPAVCAPTAERLEANAKLMGAMFDANAAPAETEPAGAIDAIGDRLLQTTQESSAEAPPASADSPPST